MKYRHLERCKVTLETDSPVFIGSASQENLSKKETIMLPQDGLILIPDLNRLVALLEQRNSLEAFEKYLTDETDNRRLDQFLKSQSIPVSAKENWIQYHLRASSGEITRVNKLARFVKNAQGMPYIPGSSVKGAIRTALLSARISQSELETALAGAERNVKAKRGQGEDNPLRVLKLDQRGGKDKDAVNDLLRCLEISDSAPFGDNSLVVCKKLELTPSGQVNGISSESFRGKSAPPLYRECLRPGLKTTFYLTIDTMTAGTLLDVGMIEKALRGWQKTQNEYADRFDQWDIDLKGMQSNGIPIVLGGGVGFQSKSLLMKLQKGRDEAIHRILKQQFYQRYKPRNDDPAPYRMKLAAYNGAYYPMGRCTLTLEE